MADENVLGLADKRVSTNEDLKKLFENMNNNTINLVPSTITFGARPELVLGFTLVDVDNFLPEYEAKYGPQKGQKVKAKGNNDIYSVNEGTLFALHLKKLKEIGQAAGVKISKPEEIGREKDKNDKPIRITYRVAWEKQEIDGSKRSGEATGEASLDEVIEKCRDYKGDVDQKRVNKQWSKLPQLAVSNATGRAIRDALPKMKGTFTLKELKKPFLVPCVIKDMTALISKYPELEKMLIAKELGLLNEMNSGVGNNLLSANISNTAPKQEDNNTDKKKEDTKDADFTEIKNKDIEDDDLFPAAKNNEMSEEDKAEAYRKELLEIEPIYRIRQFNELLESKNRTWQHKENKRYEDLSAEDQVKYYLKLEGMSKA